MTPKTAVDGETLARMLSFAEANLRKHAKDINDLNVFPIPDGDTGDNMLMTLSSGVGHLRNTDKSISEVARYASEGMLLGARGNSGVILSQIFDGIAEGLNGLYSAQAADLVGALRCGVTYSYNAVVQPTEGTILTVLRCAVEHVENMQFDNCSQLLCEFISKAEQTLQKTPEMLRVLKKAGVVDSGGAGLICIFKGMLEALEGGELSENNVNTEIGGVNEVNVDLFTEDSVLEYGYCTELLIRLQKCKTDVESFDPACIAEGLKDIGDSIAVFKTGSAVKLHIHTYHPDKVLAFCQRYGEFLKIKIENMSLQHNNIPKYAARRENNEKGKKERKKYGVVACTSGKGIAELFSERGADIIINDDDGINPSVEDFLTAFENVNADTVFVLPNHANVILTARQAAGMYDPSCVRVINSKNIGEGYAALSVLSFESDNADTIAEEMTAGMENVVTAEILRAVKSTDEVRAGEYVGFAGKNIIDSEESRYDAACRTAEKLSNGYFEACILIKGVNADENEAKQLEKFISSMCKGVEVFLVNGLQTSCDYIIIFE